MHLKISCARRVPVDTEAGVLIKSMPFDFTSQFTFTDQFTLSWGYALGCWSQGRARPAREPVSAACVIHFLIYLSIGTKEA